MARVKTGLENLVSQDASQSMLKGDIAYLCHSASVDENFILGAMHLKKLFGKRLVKIFGPQHGFVTDVQDNMVETDCYVHPYFNLPVHSLYGENRIPTDEMLKGIDTFVVDLQDVGTRVYTYISTLRLLMQACAKKGIKVVVLDRPNPVGGEQIEGNILESDWQSFVGMYNIPMRHSLTMGEAGAYAKKEYKIDVDYEVIKMTGWNRSMYWADTGLAWVNPSPNLPTPEGCITFCGTVLFEGTNVSEGRGTTRSLELLGAPEIEPYSWVELLNEKLKDWDLEGFVLRPAVFLPTFQKHAGVPCGGLQIHVTDNTKFNSWRLGQFLVHAFQEQLGSKFSWNKKPYEYEFKGMAIDFINGSEKIRQWCEQSGDSATLETLELAGRVDYLNKRSDILIY